MKGVDPKVRQITPSSQVRLMPSSDETSDTLSSAHKRPSLPPERRRLLLLRVVDPIVPWDEGRDIMTHRIKNPTATNYQLGTT